MFPDTNFPFFFHFPAHYLSYLTCVDFYDESFSLLMGERSAHLEGQSKDLFKFRNYKLLCKFMQ